MVYNSYIKCQVCGTITRVRLQVGWLNEHPIIVTCGKCGTSLSGTAMEKQEGEGLVFEFENADIVGNTSADYIVECSGEFPTKKQIRIKKCEHDEISPFIRTMSYMKDDACYKRFADAVLGLEGTAAKWTDYKRIIDLFRNNSEYLVSEIRREFACDVFQCRDEFEILRAVHMIEVHGFYSYLKPEILDYSHFSNRVLRLDISKIKSFIEYLNSIDGYHLDELQEIIYRTYDEFVKIYRYLIPALSLQYCREDAFDFEVYGSTTSTFDNVKHFYQNIYEALGTLLIIPVGLNNIEYRSNMHAMNKIKKDVTSLSDFLRQTKAIRYNYCVDGEVYSSYFGDFVNNKMRNAIGHNDVIDYDSINQLITYIPNPKDRTKKLTEHLLQFESEAIQMFQAILVISELLYRLREASLLCEGKTPIMLSE